MIGHSAGSLPAKGHRKKSINLLKNNKMKNLAQVKKDNSEYKTLIQAVINNIGIESVEDVNNHGINGGFSGFIYYSDTLAFYEKHRKLINSMVFNMSDEFGEEPINFVSSFRCVNNDNETKKDIGICIYDGNLSKLSDDVHVPNALAWFAAEEVCRMFEE